MLIDVRFMCIFYRPRPGAAHPASEPAGFYINPRQPGFEPSGAPNQPMNFEGLYSPGKNLSLCPDIAIKTHQHTTYNTELKRGGRTYASATVTISAVKLL